jgi:hypothetical protein
MENTGQQLKQLRISLALTLEQVEEETKVRSGVIISIEDDNTASIRPIYLNAYKKTLLDFYTKASNNVSYLTSIKNISITKSVPVNKFVPNEQIQEVQNNKKNDKLNPTTENKFEKSSEIKRSQIKYNNYEKDNYNTDITSSFTAVPMEPKDIRKAVKNKETNLNNTDSQVKKNISLVNVVEIVEEKLTDASSEKFKQRNLFVNFNKKVFKHSLNITLRDLLIYISGGLVIATIIFFVFIYDSKIESNMKQQVKYDTIDDSIISITSKEKDIYTYFTNDSVILTARCKDTAWVKVELDNKKIDDLLMKPGMENRWAALEKITITTSNVGGINFYKNDTLLPMLGPKGTMVQNIVLTRDGIKNINPLSSGNEVVSANELHPNQNVVIPSVIDTTKQKKRQYVNRKKKEEPPAPIIIDFSKPVTTKPSILDNDKKNKEKEKD